MDISIVIIKKWQVKLAKLLLYSDDCMYTASAQLLTIVGRPTGENVHSSVPFKSPKMTSGNTLYCILKYRGVDLP